MNGDSLRITSDGLEPLDMDDWSGGWVTTAIDSGAPQVRGNVDDRPGGDGTIDRTALVGARAVTVGVTLTERPNSLRQLLDRLAPFLHPSRRSRLELTTGYTTRTLTVRSDGDVPVPWRAGYLQLSLGWVSVGYPYWVGDRRSIILTPTILSGDGVIPPVTPPVTLAAGDPDQSGVVVNSGSVAAHWVAEIQGPVSDIAIVNASTGEQVALTGLTLLAGQTMIVDSFTRTVTVDGESRFAAVDSAVSRWWTLRPGESVLAIPTSSAANPSRVWFRWSDTYYL